MESAVTDPDGQTELCDVIDEDDSHYRVTFTPKQNGKHILSIKHKAMHVSGNILYTKIVSEYDQEIPQSQTADNPVAPRGRAAQPSQDTRKLN